MRVEHRIERLVHPEKGTEYDAGREFVVELLQHAVHHLLAGFHRVYLPPQGVDEFLLGFLGVQFGELLLGLGKLLLVLLGYE